MSKGKEFFDLTRKTKTKIKKAKPRRYRLQLINLSTTTVKQTNNVTPMK